MKSKFLRTIVTSAWFYFVAPLFVIAQPYIAVQPTNRFLTTTPASVAFVVGAGGAAPLSYQWLFNGAPISGATSSALVVHNPTPAQWGYYSVIVTNNSGSVTSQVAELKVFNPARHSLSGIQPQADRSVNLSFLGETTADFALYYDLYPLEGSLNLLNWAPLALVQRSNTALDTLRFEDTNAPNFSQRFYRTPTNQLATPDPAPTGPYAVGTFAMVMTDPNRTNAAGYGTNYQFMTTFWYPAVAQAGVLPAIYVEPQVAYGNNWDFDPYAAEVAAFFSHSWSNAPLATNLTRYPVLLYSPGGGCHRRDSADKVEDLASWGYVVVAMDTSDTPVSVFPDGRVVNSVGSPTETQIIESRLQDERFVLDQLMALDAGDPRLAGRLDLDRIGAFGPTYGGSTAAQLCLRDPRCKAGAGMDSSFVETDLLAQTLSVPYLLFRSDWGTDPEPGIVGASPDNLQDDRFLVFNNLVTNAYWVKVSSIGPLDFPDSGLISGGSFGPPGVWFPCPPPSGQLLPEARTSQIVRAYLLSFFNKFLKREDDHLLDGPSAAYPEVLQFLSTDNVSGPPQYPKGGLVQGADGNFYGTTSFGGSSGNYGTVFRMGTNGAFTMLFAFNGTNGSRPSATLTPGSDGSFYGTTACGGTAGNNGTVFKVTTNGVLTTLVSFNGANGSAPFAPLTLGNDGNFYGTTTMGGTSNLGTAFRMTPAGTLTTLVSFTGANGSAPFAPLVQGTDGNFYGTAAGGGAYGSGIVFRMTAGGALTTLVSFHGDNGWDPAAGLALGSNGWFYGTAEYGGQYYGGSNPGPALWGFGTAFKMSAAGAFTTLLDFGGTNGTYQVSGMTQGNDGNFYGTTAGGGVGGGGFLSGGTVFKMSPAGALTTLVSFNGVNGSRPQAALVQGSDGNFYGTTEFGGQYGGGTVFRVTPTGVLTTLVAFGSSTNSP